MRRRFTAEDRQRFVDEVRAGASVSEVAARVGLNSAVGYRWVKAARERSAPRFARVVPTAAVVRESNPTIVVRVGSAAVQVEPGFDASLLRAVISALSNGTK